MVRGEVAAFLHEVGQRGGQARVEHLAVHVELELPARRVADADRGRALVPGKPVELHLREPPLAAHAVHDLEVARVPGERALQPLLPGGRLLDVAR